MTDNNRPPRKPPTRSPRGAPERRPEPAAEPRDDARVAKIMARAGLCSRRDAESWIAAGRVAVNGAVIDTPALNIRPGDRVTVDGMPLPEREQTRLFLFHKPRGCVTTAKDPEGRETIFDILPPELPRVVTVGRLDINTEGLMLLTNDGGLARVLELPSTGWLRRYRVRANGEITQPDLDALTKGVTIDGVDYAGIEARLDRVQGANAWLTLGLREGKNREIKRVLEHLGMAVTRLIRISFGPFQLGELPAGHVEEVRSRVLRDQLGEALAREAGVEFAAEEEGRRPRRAEETRPAREGRPTREVRPGRDGRERRSAVPEPLTPPRATRPTGGTRAHVSALRTAREDAASEGRRRTERGSTADRKGRAVAVERVSSTAQPEAASGTRNARRFAAEKDFARPERTGRTRTGAADRPDFGGPRRSRDGAPGREGGRTSEGRGFGGPGRTRDGAPGREGGRTSEGRGFGGPGRARDGAPGREGGRSSEGRSFGGPGRIAGRRTRPRGRTFERRPRLRGPRPFAGRRTWPRGWTRKRGPLRGPRPHPRRRPRPRGWTLKRRPQLRIEGSPRQRPARPAGAVSGRWQTLRRQDVRGQARRQAARPSAPARRRTRPWQAARLRTSLAHHRRQVQGPQP